MAYKGQLSIDFYVALVIFIGFIGYITFQLFQTVPASSTNLKEEAIRIDAYQISELLINDGGYPIDWETKQLADIKRIGLSDTTKNLTNYLSRQKSVRLQEICVTNGNYQAVKDKLDLQYETSITFIEHTLPTDIIWICKSPMTTNKKFTFNISRTVSIDGTSFGEIVIEVWRT